MIDFNIRRKRGKHSDLVKHNGFTLAEVLVTLGIIGVVSAMTVPTLVQNYQRKSFVTQLHKVYSEVGQAAERYAADNNVVSLTESRLRGNSTEVNRFATTYFKVVKNCHGSYIPCFSENYDNINEDSFSVKGYTCMFTGTLASGASICIDTGAAESEKADKDINGDGVVDDNDVIRNNGVSVGQALTIEVDINGPQGPNVSGRDLFTMDVASNGMVYDSKWKEDGSSFSLKPYGPTGIGKIIEDGWEMKY